MNLPKLRLPTFKIATPASHEGFRMDFEAHASDFGLVTQVFSEGPIGAEIALVGEGPGEQEVAKERPFIGLRQVSIREPQEDQA